jgi:hypothetical protein
MPQLGRFDEHIIDRLGTSVAGADVNVYREGATVQGNQSGTTPLAVTVRHAGKIATGDSVFVDAATGTTYSATRTSATVITLSGFTGTLSLSGGSRLTPSNNKPTIYADDQGGATTSQPLLTSSTGRAQCWIEFGAYDYVVSGGGTINTTFVSEVQPTEAPGQVRYADSFLDGGTVTGGIQEAIDDLGSNGGVVHLSGPKTYTITGTTAATSSIWLHSNVTLVLNGATVKRGSGSLASARSVINACAFGSNGTLPTSAGTLSNITVVGPGIIDGNQAVIGGNVGIGVEIKFTADLKLSNFTVQNCLQDGIETDECKHVAVSNIHIDTCGQAAGVTSRNGISCYNNSGTGNAAGFSRYYTINNVSIKSVNDNAMSFLNVANVAVSNVSVDTCNYVIELQTGAATIATGDNRNLSFSNFSAVNYRGPSIALITTVTNHRYDNVTLSNSNFDGDASLHDASPLTLFMSGTTNVSNIAITNCNFSNVNAKDTTGRSWANVQATGTGVLDGVLVSNCIFRGKTGSTRTNDYGAFVAGSVKNVVFADCHWGNVPGTGFAVADQANNTTEDVQFIRCKWDTCGTHGSFIGCGTASGTIRGVYVTDCIVKDCGTQTGSNAYFVQNNAAGSTSFVFFRNCRAWRTTSANMNVGCSINGTTGTVDEITIDGCLFKGMLVTPLAAAGAPTNMHFRPLPGKGTNITSAATVAIPTDGDVFHVTGATNITNGITVNQWDNGRLATLIFDSTPTVSDTGTSVLAGNFVATADDTLSLRCDGTNWYEVGRSAN